MSSIPGLPTPGSDVTILITRVNLNPLCVLVELWGNFTQEKKADYQHLAKDIQSPRNIFREFEGNPGDQCLVQVDDAWYRSRIVSRNESKYSVFLIDKGWTIGATTSILAWGKKEFFHLPPEVEFCVLSNVLPLSSENKWSPMAMEFLKSLSGKSVKACVQDVLVPYRTILLHIPSISKQMYEMGFAKKLSTGRFKDYVLRSLQSDSGTAVSPGLQPNSVANDSLELGDQIGKQQRFMYPELPTGTVETVVITEVTNPLRIFCQLKVFSQELKKLTEQITQHYEGRISTCFVGPDMLGSPCAARGIDGRWYRSVLQQVLPASNVVEVLNVDYGKKQFVQVENVKPLAAEFFRMPVVTYICSLHGIIDKGVGWTASQIDHLKSLLLHKTVIGKFEYQSLSEGVHYVTLYGIENANINHLFGSKERCLLECDKSLGDYDISSITCKPEYPVQRESRGYLPMSAQAVKGTTGRPITEKLILEDLPLDSLHVAVVQHVSSPSEFWIQTQKYAIEFDELMDSISDLYKDSVNEDLVRTPTVGLYCAAKAKGGAFCRATVSGFSKNQIKVFFVDYGKTEVIDRSSIRALPDKFKELPQLALKCKLAGVKPTDETWSHRATAFFITTVTDKLLDVKVTAKCDGGYVVWVTDSAAHGERDVSKLMCSSGFAEKDEAQKKAKIKVTNPPAVTTSALNPGIAPREVHKNSGTSFQTQNATDPSKYESRVATFKEQMFSIGNTLDVSVSYIESPNDFWCQLVPNAGHLKLLMQDMQTYYACSQFQPFVETACVARHPHNGMWYRALVIQKKVMAHVNVLFVDYGQMTTVPLHDLRRICPAFLRLEGQAFRCSLYNPVEPTSAINDWDEEAVAQFQDFVDTAASNHVVLRCTIYAIMYNEQKVVFNIVDLETPFESVCTRVVHLAKRAPPKKAPGSSFRLDTYYYSTHNIKTGTEETVTVTCVNSINKFYCQLERNTDVLNDLTMNLSALCNQLKNVKLPTAFGLVCFAKYTDGHWYRGQIKATQPSILVHFVDYGDTLEVDRSHLLPVPMESSDIMSVPVQAVECGLSDIPANVQSEVNSWFQTNATDQSFRALVVAKEPGGKLLVELYYGKTQVNSKIKKMFCIGTDREERDVYQGRKALEASANHAQQTPMVVSKQDMKVKDETKANLWTASKHSRHVDENGQRAKAPTLEPYRTPRQRQMSDRTPATVSSGPVEDYTTKQVKNIAIEAKQFVTCKLPCAESQMKSNVTHRPKIEALPKLTDLPSKSITSGMEADVFVSHCNSLLSFYVQFVREEDDLFSIVEKLNNNQPTAESIDIKDLHSGDLVQAEFPDDSSWYRAVVREIHGNRTVLVEFVDFGNTAVVSNSKICRLCKPFLQCPVYSTHCLLSEAALLGKEVALDPEIVSAFKKDIGGNGDKRLKCRFIRQSGSLWEVSLQDSGMKVMCQIPNRTPTVSEITPEEFGQVEKMPGQSSATSEKPPEQPSVNTGSLCYIKPDFSEGQKLEAYVTTITGPQSFWCQSADSEELDKITVSVSEEGNAVQCKLIDANMLSCGSPCIGLFADDEQWYRAEVIGKDGDTLSILFVDYGNESKVNVRDVREMPPELLETPAQAFLCELEGFEASHGSRDDGAVDGLSELIMEKLLKLTVVRVSREDGKTKYFVQVECEGQAIHESVKCCKTSKTENKADTTGLSPSYPTSLLPCHSALKESAVPESHPPQEPENPLIREMDAAVDFMESQRDHQDEHHGELVIPPPAPDEASQLTSNPKSNDCSDGSVQSESLAGLQKEEMDHIPSESNVVDKPKTVTKIQSLREMVSKQLEKTVPSIVISEAEPNDGGFPPDQDGKHDTSTSSSGKNVLDNGKDDEQEVASVIEQAVGPNDSNCLPCSDETHKEALAPSANQTPTKLVETVPENTESAPIIADMLQTQRECSHMSEEESETAVTKSETLPEEVDADSEEDNSQLNSTDFPDSEFGPLRAATCLCVGSTCVVWSPALKSWCKAKILKNLRDCVLVVLDDDTNMEVDPDSIFEVVLPQPEQCDNDDCCSVSSQSELQDVVVADTEHADRAPPPEVGGVTCLPEEACSEGVTCPPDEACSEGVTCPPDEACSEDVTCPPDEACSEDVTCPPDKACSEGVTCPPDKACSEGVTCPPDEACSEDVTCPPDEACSEDVTCPPDEACSEDVTCPPDKACSEGARRHGVI
ncbi:tudor domain-containing 6 [Polymixia lowei]